MDPNTIALQTHNLTLSYVTPRSTTHAVRDVSLEIAAHEFAGIVGPSGSGKSSLLDLLAGLKNPTAGRVSVGGLDYHESSVNARLDFRRRHFGFIFQQPFLIPYLTIIENVLVPIERAGAADARRALDLLDSLDIADLAPKYPNECSGGERVRAAMARGIVHRPHYLFVDEPTANLDLATGQRVMRLLETQREHGVLVLITHDHDILGGADVIFRMRDGHLIDSTRPAELM